MSDKNVFSAAAAISAADCPSEWIDVPEWGGGCFIRGMSGAQRDALETEVAKRKGGQHFRARVVQMCCYDDKGRQIFGVHQITDLTRKGAAVLDRIVDVALRLSGMDDKERREIEKNFEMGASDSSGSASVPTSAS